LVAGGELRYEFAQTIPALFRNAKIGRKSTERNVRKFLGLNGGGDFAAQVIANQKMQLTSHRADLL
jgi:hypothetical protein